MFDDGDEMLSGEEEVAYVLSMDWIEMIRLEGTVKSGDRCGMMIRGDVATFAALAGCSPMEEQPVKLSQTSAASTAVEDDDVVLTMAANPQPMPSNFRIVSCTCTPPPMLSSTSSFK